MLVAAVMCPWLLTGAGMLMCYLERNYGKCKCSHDPGSPGNTSQNKQTHVGSGLSCRQHDLPASCPHVFTDPRSNTHTHTHSLSFTHSLILHHSLFLFFRMLSLSLTEWIITILSPQRDTQPILKHTHTHIQSTALQTYTHPLHTHSQHSYTHTHIQTVV